jgi:hypothetical protein
MIYLPSGSASNEIAFFFKSLIFSNISRGLEKAAQGQEIKAVTPRNV